MQSVYFKSEEFACRCGCGFAAIDPALLRVLEAVRRHFNTPVWITSGCRCAAHNAAIGGVAQSRHVRGQAADIVVKKVAADVVADYLEECYPDRCGIGRYADWTHIDIRSEKARWQG